MFSRRILEFLATLLYCKIPNISPLHIWPPDYNNPLLTIPFQIHKFPSKYKSPEYKTPKIKVIYKYQIQPFNLSKTGKYVKWYHDEIR